MRTFIFAFCLFLFSASAQAEYSFGKVYQVQNDAFEFNTKELFIDGKFVGYVDDAPVIKFSNNFYVFASCPTDRITAKPNGFCINWKIYDVRNKVATDILLPGLNVFTMPSFSWPFVAYVQVPEDISKEDFRRGLVNVSCVVVEWTTKKVVAQEKVLVNVGHFETDFPGSFHPPEFVQNKNGLNVTCLEDDGQGRGNIIATVHVP